MTTMSFNATANHLYFSAPRAPMLSFAARLAALQDKRDRAPHLADHVRATICGVLALVPFTAIAWVFVTF
jgi:hypothetical protein